ncbi:hypothetical protein ES703_122677 [subsurface metagenome]
MKKIMMPSTNGLLYAPMLRVVGVKPPVGMVLKVTVNASNAGILARQSEINSKIEKPRYNNHMAFAVSRMRAVSLSA